MGNPPKHSAAAALGVLLICLVSGCGDGDSPKAAAEPSVLRVGAPMQVRQANPLTDYSYSIFAMLATHDTLVRFDPAMNPYPQLAESWEASPDGKEWRFHLRSDALWHDGRPVTPADVRFTFDYLARHHPASLWIRDLIEDIRIDGRTVGFFLTKPFSRFLINGGFIIRILPQHIWSRVADPQKPGDAAVTVGSGPFIFDGFDVRGGRVAFRKNDRYYGPPPVMDRLEFHLNGAFDALTLMLQRGDIDVYYKYASGFPASYLPGLHHTRQLQVISCDGMGIPAAVGFNLGRYPASVPEFRKALVSALNYERIGQSLLGASGKIPTGGFVPPVFDHHLKQPPLNGAPEESRRLLNASGFTDTDGDGLRNRPGDGNLSLTLLARSDLEGVDGVLPIIVHNLKEVGIDLRVERADLSTWLVRVQENRFDLVLFRTTPWGMVMEAGCASGYFDSRRQGGGALANVADPVFHDLCDRLLGATDPAAQERIHHDMQRYYAIHLPAAALCWAVDAYPAGGRWRGFVVNPVEGGLVNRQTFSGLTQTSPVR